MFRSIYSPTTIWCYAYLRKERNFGFGLFAVFLEKNLIQFCFVQPKTETKNYSTENLYQNMKLLQSKNNYIFYIYLRSFIFAFKGLTI